MRRSLAVTAAAAVAAGVLVGPATSASAAVLSPFGHACAARDGVRFCPTDGLGQRVPSWDGTPLDVDVTLPAGGDGPFPTIVMLHGLGQDKTAFQDAGTQALTADYNTDFYARRGYAVVTPTARGFGNSCGAATRTSPGCARGWVHIDDARFEARDVQHLLGILVDEGIADPAAIGSTGISYGGGTSAQLAFLKDRIELPDGSFAAWTSPAGTPLRISAAYPRWGWASLAGSLVPNGRDSSETAPNYRAEVSPVGVPKLSYTTFLFLITELTGNVAPAGVDPDADLINWFRAVLAGEPYTGPSIEGLIRAAEHKGTTAIPGVPAPMLIENGWTDDLFPAQQGLALYNQARAASPTADVTLQLADTGHPGASNRPALVRRLVDAGAAFFDAKLRGTAAAPAPGSVALSPMTCPAGAATPAARTSPTWAAAHPGTLTFGQRGVQSTTSSGLNFLGEVDRDPVVSTLAGTVGNLLTQLITGQLDPGDLLGAISGDPAAFGQLFSLALTSSDPCRAEAAAPSANSIGALGPVRTRPATLAGMPTVSASVLHTGADGQLDARLWDVRPNGTQVLVTRGTYRITSGQAGRASFQLNGNAYTFAAGDRPRLEILSSDSPYARPSNGVSTTFATDVQVALPTAEAAP
jgi:dienelactone hydrolase